MSFPNVIGLRNGFLETEHRYSQLVCDIDGQVICQTKQAETERCFIRSSLKPFQAFVSLQNTTIPLLDEELALIIASHSGNKEQQYWVASLLNKAHCSVEDLQCGTHLPFDKALAESLVCSGQPATAMHHNCSGKHAGMLLACACQGWDKTTYRHLTHPYQQQLVQLLKLLCPQETFDAGMDGCGVPVYSMSLKTMAILYAKLVTLPGFQRIVGVMKAYPQLIGDSQRIDSLLMSMTEGRLIAKVGADGLLLLANTETQQGCAFKLWDGQNNIRDKVVVAALLHTGWISIAEASALKKIRPNLCLSRLNNQHVEIGAYQINFG